MGHERNDEFRKDGLSSGLTRGQVADDLGVGMSTLNKWITAHRDTDVMWKAELSLARQNDRLQREVRILKEERGILRRATQFFASQKPRGSGSGSSKNVAIRFRHPAYVML